MAEDRRGELQRAALKTGQVYFGEPQERRGYLVWNLGKSGAMIEIESDTAPPSKFRLISAALYINQNCEVIWRDGRKIALKFAGSTA